MNGYTVYQHLFLEITGLSIQAQLVDNAIKFTQTGEVFIGVQVISKNANEQYELLFEVRDSGIGIPADKMERLFKAFSQVDSSTTRKYGGTGLGLAISQKLVQLMGGRIWVESEPDKGSSFFFTIQTQQVLFRQIMNEQEQQTGTAEELTVQEKLPRDFSEKYPLRILVAEDNMFNQQVITHILNKMGYAPQLAENGELAVAMLRSSNYDLVLMDMQMPEKAGRSGGKLEKWAIHKKAS